MKRTKSQYRIHTMSMSTTTQTLSFNLSWSRNSEDAAEIEVYVLYGCQTEWWKLTQKESTANITLCHDDTVNQFHVLLVRGNGSGSGSSASVKLNARWEDMSFGIGENRTKWINSRSAATYVVKHNVTQPDYSDRFVVSVAELDADDGSTDACMVLGLDQLLFHPQIRDIQTFF